MFKTHQTLFVFSFLLLTFSCTQSSKQLPDSTGKLGTLVIVAAADIHRDLKPVYDSVFLQTMPHTTAGVPFLEILRPDVQDFQHFYFNQRSILVMVSESSLESMEELLEPFSKETITQCIQDKKPILKTEKNMFAKPQHLVFLFGKDAKDLETKLMLCREELSRSMSGLELQAEAEVLYKDSSPNDRYFEEIKSAFGLGVKIPAMFNLKKQGKDMYLFQADLKEGQTPKTIGLIIHTYPYKDTSDFSYVSIRTMRDTVCKYLVTGEIKGTYMGTTESNYYPPVWQESSILNGNSCKKIRGWWTIRGVSMAGPYLRYVVQVPSKKMIFAFEGFVYRPNLDLKERDLRLIESIALTIQ